MKKIVSKISISWIQEKFKALSWDILLPVFVLSLALQSAHFFPDLREINIWDEATYIHNGLALLTEGKLSDLAGSPLSSLLYALSSLPVLRSPDVFVLTDAIGRIFLFTLIFFSAWLIARALKPYTHPWIMVGFVFVVPVATTMYLFPSDVLFAGFSGLTFWQMLRFYHRRARKHLWWASALMGLGALARAEGILLIGVMLLVTLIMVLPSRKWFRDLLAVLIPFGALVGGYILFFGLVTGDFGTGLPERTFNNFESGHEIIYSQTGVFTPTISARLESREVFGTPEENGLSVFKAIRRNPQIYWLRVRKQFTVLPGVITEAYGNKFLLILVWLSLRGAVELVRRKKTPLLLMCVFWLLPLGVGFLNTFFRVGYFKMPYFVIFALSSIGLSAILDHIQSRWEQIGMILGSVFVLGIGALSRNTSMLFRSGLFVLGLGLVYLLWRRLGQGEKWRSQALWLILVVAVIMRGGFLSPELPVYGRSDVERSVYFLQDNLSEDSLILAGAPAMIWAARMDYAGINSYDIPSFESPQAFLSWVEVQGMDAIYVDLHFPALYRQMVEALSGQGLVEVYATPERDIVIYLVGEPSQSAVSFTDQVQVGRISGFENHQWKVVNSFE